MIVVLIPAFNEKNSISEVVTKSKNYCDKVIVIDDGSTDATARLARESGAEVISHARNLGLGAAIRTGLEKCMEIGADIVVQIDSDGQYLPEEIPKLLEPIRRGEADIVLGSRFLGKIEKMPARKKLGNRVVSWLVRRITGLNIRDSQTGFRALTRDAVLKLNLFASYTYTQEMIIQAAYKKLRIKEVPCTFKKRSGGKSRLISNIFSYATNVALIILRTFRDYRPLAFFGVIGSLFILSGVIIGGELTLIYLNTGAINRTPSVVLTAILLIFGLQIMIFGFLADMMRRERYLLENILEEKVKR